MKMPFPAAEDSSLWTAGSSSSSCARAAPREDRLAAGQGRHRGCWLTRDCWKQNSPEGLRAAGSLQRNFLTITPELTSHEAAAALPSCHLLPPVSCPALLLQLSRWDAGAELFLCRAQIQPSPFHTSHPAWQSRKSHPVLTHGIQQEQIKNQQAKAA